MVVQGKQQKGYQVALQRLRDRGGQEAPRKQNTEAAGFVKWNRIGFYVAGTVTDVWPVEIEGEERHVATIRVKEIDADVTSKDEDGKETLIEVGDGDSVYVGVSSADLVGRITDEHKGMKVVIAYTGNQKLRRGTKKLFDVVLANGNPEGQDDEKE